MLLNSISPCINHIQYSIHIKHDTFLVVIALFKLNKMTGLMLGNPYIPSWEKWFARRLNLGPDAFCSAHAFLPAHHANQNPTHSYDCNEAGFSRKKKKKTSNQVPVRGLDPIVVWPQILHRPFLTILFWTRPRAGLELKSKRHSV